MICPFPLTRRAAPPRTSLLHLFESVLARQLLPLGTERGVHQFDDGASIWLPDAELVITSPGSDSPIEGFTPAETAEYCGIDVLAIDLGSRGDVVECQLELFASNRAHKFSVEGLALWLSPHLLAGLVPVRPRDECDPLPPCFALTPTGVTWLADPFPGDVEWKAGITRATDALLGRPSVLKSSRKTVLELVR